LCLVVAADVHETLAEPEAGLDPAIPIASTARIQAVADMTGEPVAVMAMAVAANLRRGGQHGVIRGGDLLLRGGVTCFERLKRGAGGAVPLNGSQDGIGAGGGGGGGEGRQDGKADDQGAAGGVPLGSSFQPRREAYREGNPKPDSTAVLTRQHFDQPRAAPPTGSTRSGVSVR
jgi:hypothetical protein